MALIYVKLYIFCLTAYVYPGGVYGSPTSRRSTPSCSLSSTDRMTSGCSALSPISQAGAASELQSLARRDRYSIEHVNGVMDELKDKVIDLEGTLLEANSAWQGSIYYTPVGSQGLNRLYPTQTDGEFPSPDTILSGSTHSHVLIHMRWWLTALEEHTIHLEASGLLGPVQGPSLVRRMSRLSDDLNALLPILEIHPRNMLSQAVCAEIPASITDSATRRAQYTSVALRDLHRAFNRIKTVLNSCAMVSHPTGQHQVKLECQHHHLFYHAVPHGTVHMYDYTHFLCV